MPEHQTLSLSAQLQPAFPERGILNFLAQEDGERNGTPLQYSCLENPMDGGAW